MYYQHKRPPNLNHPNLMHVLVFLYKMFHNLSTNMLQFRISFYGMIIHAGGTHGS